MRSDWALPAELSIYTVSELRAQWLAALNSDDHELRAEREVCRVDGAAVDTVDAAGVQLLLSLRRSLTDRGCRLDIVTPSTALSQGCTSMGLGGTLLAAPGAGAAK